MSAQYSSLKSAPRITRGSVVLSLAAAVCLPVTFAQGVIDQDKLKQGKSRGAFPTLNILPEGSILRRVRLPRYDKDFNPISLLSAEQLTVLDSHRIGADGVTIELYEADGSLQARAKMRRATYDQKNSTLHAEEAVYLKGKSYVASGTGLIFHWETNQGFLNGPASTRFHFQKDTAMNTLFPSHNSRLQSCVLISSFLTFSTALVAEPPAKLTSEQLSELEELSRSVAAEAAARQSETRSRIQEHDQLEKDARARITPFLKDIKKDALLVQKPAEPKPGTAPAPIKAPALKPGESTLLVECDGGLYFDNDAGILAYLKNIRLTEDRFRLTCSDELKVFLEQKPAEEAPKKADSPKTAGKEKEGQLSSFGNLKQIIATGNVKVTRKDDKGNLFIAMAETASYEAKSGEIILRGGFPKLQQAANQYLQAQQPGQWIRVLKNGKLVTSSGKWKMIAVLKNR